MGESEIRKKVHEYINESDDSTLRIVYAMLEVLHAEAGLGTSIDQYNKEIDEAMGRIDGGEFYTHEQAVELLKQNKHGKKNN